MIQRRTAAPKRISIATIDIRLAAALDAVSQKMTSSLWRRIGGGFYQKAKTGVVNRMLLLLGVVIRRPTSQVAEDGTLTGTRNSFAHLRI